jgi:hypothetical protein
MTTTNYHAYGPTANTCQVFVWWGELLSNQTKSVFETAVHCAQYQRPCTIHRRLF